MLPRRLPIVAVLFGFPDAHVTEYRYYWQPSWKHRKPLWLAAENPEWKGNYKVKYWSAQWKRIIYGGAGSYVDRIIAAGFDGVYLDIIDAFEYFEEK